MLLAMLGVAAVLAAREAAGGAALVAALAIKASAAFAAPFALIGSAPLLAGRGESRGRRPALPAGGWRRSA